MNTEEAVKEYQCPGCVNGPYVGCFKVKNVGVGCGSHCAGTAVSSIGAIFLGLPKGFNRKGDSKMMDVTIFKTYMEASNGWGYDWLNIAVWKYLDERGNTIVRGMSPRINYSWVHVILGDCRAKFGCYEVTEANINMID